MQKEMNYNARKKQLPIVTTCYDFDRATAICTAIAGVPYLTPFGVRFAAVAGLCGQNLLIKGQNMFRIGERKETNFVENKRR